MNLPYFSVIPDPFKLLPACLIFARTGMSFLTPSFLRGEDKFNCLKMERYENIAVLCCYIMKVPYVVVTGEYIVGLTTGN